MFLHHASAARRLALPLLFCLASAALDGCAASPSAEGAAATDAGAPVDRDGDPAAAKTCPPDADFGSDANNCGRCGRVCDDGTCNHGICNPRTELELDGRTCVGDLVVHGDKLYAALEDKLVTLAGGKAETVLAWPNGRASVQRSLASDGKNLWVAMAGSGDVESGDARALRFAHFDEAGVRSEDVISPQFPITTSFVAAGDGRIAHLDVVGNFAFVDETRNVRTFDFGRSPAGIRSFGGDFFVGVEISIVRVSKSGARSVVRDDVHDRDAPWTVTEDGIVDLDVGPERVTLRQVPPGSAAPTELASVTVADAQKLLATVVPGVEPIDAQFEGSWQEPDGLVFASGAFYFTVAIPDRGRPNDPHRSRAILRYTPSSGVSLFAVVGESSSASLRLRAGAGRLTWREGTDCGATVLPDRTLVRSAPL